MPNSKISVMIVEDQMLTRIGLRAVVESFPDLEVVAEAENGKLAVEQALIIKPNAVVMDVEMPVMDGIEATKQIKQLVPESNVLILTSHDLDDDVFAALAAGADGYCLKDASADSLAGAIRAVSGGATWLDQAIAKRVLRASVGTQSKAPVKAEKKNDKFALSARQTEILELLVEGLSNQQMADRLFVSNETIKTHMRHIMEKLAVADRTQAAVKALREGLLSGQQNF
ncbi:MAG: response regulator transcription factor [Candidatus Obscuribacterales bacterium]|nr:response regulator transcription factor [Candidatus Obscuribacterales bacterium]